MSRTFRGLDVSDGGRVQRVFRARTPPAAEAQSLGGPDHALEACAGSVHVGQIASAYADRAAVMQCDRRQGRRPAITLIHPPDARISSPHGQARSQTRRVLDEPALADPASPPTPSAESHCSKGRPSPTGSVLLIHKRPRSMPMPAKKRWERSQSASSGAVVFGGRCAAIDQTVPTEFNVDVGNGREAVIAGEERPILMPGRTSAIRPRVLGLQSGRPGDTPFPEWTEPAVFGGGEPGNDSLGITS